MDVVGVIIDPTSKYEGAVLSIYQRVTEKSKVMSDIIIYEVFLYPAVRRVRFETKQLLIFCYNVLIEICCHVVFGELTKITVIGKNPPTRKKNLRLYIMW